MGRSTTDAVREEPVARARWRRCFALSLALRLLARIVLLDLVVFVTCISAPLHIPRES
jgi:hypothetical protein